MAKTLIGFGDKVTGGVPKAVHEQQLWFDDVNELKGAVNGNATELYDRTDGNIPHQVVGVTVNWANLSTTVNEVDLIWAAVNSDAFTGGQRGSTVLHNHALIFKTTRKVYQPAGTIETYDIYETYWQLRDKLTVTGGALVTIGSGNTLLDSTNGFMTRYDRTITKVVDGVAQEGGFSRDFGTTGVQAIQDRVNAGSIAYPGKGLYAFRGNDGVADYLYIYNGVDEAIGTGSGVTTIASEFTVLTTTSGDAAPENAELNKLQDVSTDAYVGTRLEPKGTATQGFYYSENKPSLRVGMEVFNTSNSASATAGFVAGLAGGFYADLVSLQRFPAAFGNQYAGKGAVYSSNGGLDILSNGDGEVNVRIGTAFDTLPSVMNFKPTGAVSIPLATIAVIDAGSGKSLTTRDYVKNASGKTEYTVSTLPSGNTGDTAIVTDATAPTYLGTLTGGGAVTCPVFYNGSAWVSN